jgi:lysozyme
MTLKAGIDLIKKFEGCRLKSYPDPATGGLPITIGWGSTKDTRGKLFGLGATITQAQADTLLEYTIEHEYLPALSKIPHWNEMNENQKGALLSFAYNLGVNFYGNPNCNTITKVLKNKEWGKVPDALYLYRNPGSNVEAGLARRRKAEGDLWKK